MTAAALPITIPLMPIGRKTSGGRPFAALSALAAIDTQKAAAHHRSASRKWFSLAVTLALASGEAAWLTPADSWRST
jgi:hypothetical protein